MSNSVEETKNEISEKVSESRSLWQRMRDFLAEIMKPTDRSPTGDGFDQYIPIDHGSMAWRHYSGFHELERFY